VGAGVLSGTRSQVVALLLVAVVVLAGAGYWFFSPKTPNEMGNIVQQTSLLTPSEQSQTFTERTAITSTTTAAPPTGIWINVTATKPVSYYLSLLESNGTQPYVQLAKKLRKLPNLTNATAVAKITYLALNATNPEVKEAFELMIKGGTPDPRDFTYSVPNYNTELQVLYWLACQNEFKKDDTLALSIATVNGLWVTMGDEQVKQAVYSDITQLLGYFRETNELQKQRGYYPLENYPLEAKILLVWTGNQAPIYVFLGSRYGYESVLLATKLDVRIYENNTVSVHTLRQMRKIADDRGWITHDVNLYENTVESYFYFAGGICRTSRNWVCPAPDDRYIGNVDLVLDFFLATGKGIGQCYEETQFVDAWCKSWGIPVASGYRSYTTTIQPLPDGAIIEHTYPVYLDPVSDSWKSMKRQLEPFYTDKGEETLPMSFFIFRPPVAQRGYFREVRTYEKCFNFALRRNAYVPVWENTNLRTVRDKLLQGMPTNEMNQWLLYG
jgi:hypothetical protein